MHRAFLAVALALVAGTFVTPAVHADTWGDRFETCLAGSTYQTALTTHGWDSPEELAAYNACMDAADAAAGVEVVYLPAEDNGETYSAGDLVVISTTDADTEDWDNPADLEYETFALTAWDAALVNCTFGVEPEHPVTHPDDSSIVVTACAGASGFWD